MRANLIVTLVATTVVIVINTAQSSVNLTTFLPCLKAETQALCESEAELEILLNILNNAAACGQGSVALTLANECSMDPDIGIYCAEAMFYIGDIINLSFSTCAEAVFTPGAPCTDDCRMGLQALRNNLGCCINAYVNDTTPGNPFSFASALFTNDFWMRCNLDPVTSECDNVLDFNLAETTPSPSINPNCSYSAVVTSTFSMVCRPARLDQVADLIRNAEDCDTNTYLEYTEQLCSLDAMGNFCHATETNLYDFTNYLDPIPVVCNDTSQCSTACKTLVQRFVNDRGCCVNSLYNSTYNRATGVPYPFLDTTHLFELCGVEPPSQVCDLPTVIPTEGATQMRSHNAVVLLLFIAVMGLFML